MGKKIVPRFGARMPVTGTASSHLLPTSTVFGYPSCKLWATKERNFPLKYCCCGALPSIGEASAYWALHVSITLRKMDVLSPAPILPFDVEHTIFEMCARSRPTSIPTFMLVAWRVKEWYEIKLLPAI